MKSILSIIVLAIVLSSCQNATQKNQGSSGQKATITAAGATFPQPYYNLVFKNYSDLTGVQITYGGVGSGGGIRSLTDKVVDFGATDAFLEDDKMAEMPAPIVHFPTCLGAVVIAYNLPGVDDLKLSNELLEKIFLGEVTKWNDPLIAANNPGITFPETSILFVHRSDGSGTTAIFSDYMSKISTKWAEKVGSGKSLNWPVGMGGKGNPGVVGTISQTEGAIGYVGSEYAFAQKIQMAKVQNSSGEYVLPTIASVSAAAKGDIPEDTRIMLTNSADPESYPISGFTWIILYKEQAYNNRSFAQAEATLKLLDWLVSPDAQAQAPTVHYASLTDDAVAKAKAILRSVTYEGKPILK
jgi:phosphate transport system substrate-binding protein